MISNALGRDPVLDSSQVFLQVFPSIKQFHSGVFLFVSIVQHVPYNMSFTCVRVLIRLVRFNLLN